MTVNIGDLPAGTIIFDSEDWYTYLGLDDTKLVNQAGIMASDTTTTFIDPKTQVQILKVNRQPAQAPYGTTYNPNE